MSDYETREQRAALEAELEDLPEEQSDTSNVSTVVSVRLRGDELAAIEQAASNAGLRLGTYIRQAALSTAIKGGVPIDQRQVAAEGREFLIHAIRFMKLTGSDPRPLVRDLVEGAAANEESASERAA